MSCTRKRHNNMSNTIKTRNNIIERILSVDEPPSYECPLKQRRKKWLKISGLNRI